MNFSSGLGEREIIEKIWGCLDKMPRMPVPFGDDVSAVELGDGKLVVLKTDMLVAETDVPPGMSLRQAARKAVVMNVSDFAAKGVKPIAMLVSLGLPKKLTAEENVEEIGRGLNAGAREYNAYIIGGDTNEASDIVISVSLFGIAKKDALMLRSEAKPEDLVAVTGGFGKTTAGLKILLDGLKAPEKLRKILVNSVLMPYARLREGLALSRTRAVTASIDSSDGLAWSLHEIARASSVGFSITHLPIAKEAAEFARINNLDPLELTLYGGEEYELVLTIKPNLWEKAEKAVEKVGGKLIRIGRVTAEEQITLEINGEKHVVEPRGWEHFRSR
ncbi:thiamine-phosphate kinase [Candidatus Bathyarchaeota archaeon]|nr:MAG: thiamine-phosphate kinase [Candidatus Bathyarchaeota archaeon]